MGKPFLQLHLVDHCNLNCSGCAHFSPIADEWYISVHDVEKMLTELRPVMEQWFCRIELMGGEPLLHPQLEMIMDITREIYPNFEIRLVTNGIKLLSMPQSFFVSCKKNMVEICISIYPIFLDYNKINELLDNNGIKHRNYGEFASSKEFVCYRLNPTGGNDGKESFDSCKYAGHCVQLRNDRIYPCFIVAYVDYINKKFDKKFYTTEKDYLHLSRIGTDKNISESFNEIIHKPIPFCRYCDTKHRKFCEWKYSTYKESEWLINDSE